MIVIPLDSSVMMKYGPAMSIEDKTKAEEYFNALVVHTMEKFNLDRDSAVRRARAGLRAYSYSYSDEVQGRVRELYNL